MPRPRYQWRHLTKGERDEVLSSRKRRGHPWHSPPHRGTGASASTTNYPVSAACYEHQQIIGVSPTRMDVFSENLMEVVNRCSARCSAWCVLPNHYHALVDCAGVRELLTELGRLHGRSSFMCNGEDGTRGRKVFFRAVERAMRSEAHVWATINYVHHNPVRHGYVEKWMEWPWSSAQRYVHQMGRKEVARIWHCYPVRDYGEGWDAPDL